jgi:hypothetical protein
MVLYNVEYACAYFLRSEPKKLATKECITRRLRTKYFWVGNFYGLYVFDTNTTVRES